MTTLETATPITTENPFGLESHARAALFIPHPDDTLMTGYAVLKLAAMANGGLIESFGVYVATDGEASTIGNPAFVRSRGRRREAIADLGLYGISPANIYQPGLPDLALTGNSAMEEDVACYLEENDITTAITLGQDGGDGHPDHIALHEEVEKNEVTVFALDSQGRGNYVIKEDDNMRRKKLGGLALNRSQWLMISVAEGRSAPLGWIERDGFAMPRRVAEALDGYTHFLPQETYELVNAADYL